MQKKILKLFMIIGVLIFIYILSYPARYYCYMWMLKNVDDGGWMMDIGESVESMSPHIVPLLVNTYEDKKAYWKNRHIAALGLMKADRAKAEELFTKDLFDNDNNIVADAILELGIMRSFKQYKVIIKHVNSSNIRVRVAVARYLEKNPNEESIALLKSMLNDSNEEVRTAAKYSLTEINRLKK